ncbi:hypothetical protein [Duganella vulcania]|uniref:hypothetical protein n=1 Tax=Duganella vulcania TaxID=2692166 RepID=UPI0015829DF3|nr:hypothetical protein [Duganella vulcania]
MPIITPLEKIRRTERDKTVSLIIAQTPLRENYVCFLRFMGGLLRRSLRIAMNFSQLMRPSPLFPVNMANCCWSNICIEKTTDGKGASGVSTTNAGCRAGRAEPGNGPLQRDVRECSVPIENASILFKILTLGM